MSQLPSSVHAVVIGAGIHGLSADAPRFATGDRHR